MIAVTPALHVLVALAMATPAVRSSDCAANDLQCSALAFTAAARRATSDVERVQYLYFANRAYLALANKSPEATSTRDLCTAKQLIDQALALPATQLRERLVESRRVTLSRLTEQQIQCERPRQRKKADPPLVARADADRPGELLAPVPAAERSPGVTASSAGATPASPESPPGPSPVAAVDAGVTPSPAADRPRTAGLRVLDDEPQVRAPEPSDALMPVGAGHVSSRVDDPPRGDDPRPGRDLVIAGGVTLGVGAALTVAAGVMGHRIIKTRQEVYALDAMIVDYATPDQKAEGNALKLRHDAMRLPTLALALASGTTLIVAAVLVSVGARRIARLTSRAALLPAPGGLVFHARF
jgi:hypothetical protein